MDGKAYLREDLSFQNPSPKLAHFFGMKSLCLVQRGVGCFDFWEALTLGDLEKKEKPRGHENSNISRCSKSSISCK